MRLGCLAESLAAVSRGSRSAGTGVAGPWVAAPSHCSREATLLGGVWAQVQHGPLDEPVIAYVMSQVPARVTWQPWGEHGTWRPRAPAGRVPGLVQARSPPARAPVVSLPGRGVGGLTRVGAAAWWDACRCWWRWPTFTPSTASTATSRCATAVWHA
jgi:hypothetical protein